MSASAPTAGSQGQTISDAGAFQSLLPSSGRLIGLDAGTKTIGVALSDTNRSIATPLETIKRTKFKDDAARLLALIESNGVAAMGLMTGDLAERGGTYQRRDGDLGS